SRYTDKYERLSKTFRKIFHARQRIAANRSVIAEPAQPHQAGLAAEPRDLPLRIIARLALRIEESVARRKFPAHELLRLLITDRLERLRRAISQRLDAPHFLH